MSIQGAPITRLSGGDLLADLLGRVDNLHDPVPVLNKRPAVYGLVLVLLVSFPSESFCQLLPGYGLIVC